VAGLGDLAAGPGPPATWAQAAAGAPDTAASAPAEAASDATPAPAAALPRLTVEAPGELRALLENNLDLARP
jgi:hypothetical protein